MSLCPHRKLKIWREILDGDLYVLTHRECRACGEDFVLLEPAESHYQESERVLRGEVREAVKTALRLPRGSWLQVGDLNVQLCPLATKGVSPC
jgi:hypothetical protein